MTSDEEKGLRLRRTQLQAELARINVLLDDVPPMPTPHREVANRRAPAPPKLRGYPANRETFYRDAENDFRNTDSNGNYVTPPEDC